ncbi:xanthine dehydrogenase family protein molybdopterin-binding subunit [Marinagarivorans cellulosilyticus]|uniref:Isoquinoline 1-oxidoreductase subunit beta n=1 Tax=Marinagarivorans cellulosilyticus TaxID=2721545 RepID=A0AAN1WID5_9GAMM|nr:molybdopterin cofactor-binding domain-containing protein [Marinagarivorans cellulosilyticus]BCD98154.1 isoquinoline 1-oxidoreductase subunit beta [Marinagarivorans cellulosilyticus]
MIAKITRRSILKTVGLQGPGLILMAPMLGQADTGDKASADFALGVFISIAKTGDVTIVNHRAEMGQGILTSVPQIIADELGADWLRVSVVQAQGDAKYGNQSTGGSASIRNHFPYLRQMGAVARDMLEQTAADIWQVQKKDVKAQSHQVINLKSKKALAFGDLAEQAAKLPVPDIESVKLKDTAEFSLIGRDVRLAGQEDIVRGKTVYAQDVRLPNMLIASIERPPVVGGRVKSVNTAAAKKVAGVVDVIQLKDRSLPTNVKPVSGVAVLATNTWAAHEGRKKLDIQWDTSDKRVALNAKHNSAEYLAELVSAVNTQGDKVRKEGDVYQHSYNPSKTVEATYTVPYHHHMSMEPPAATAVVSADECTVWTGTQAPQWAKGLIAEELGIDAAKVTVNMASMGGAFGRKGKNDFTLEAVELAKAAGRPVKVVWTREDDVKHGFYHSISANYCKAEVNAKGSADYWLQRVAYPPIGATFNLEAKRPSFGQLSLGFADIPFELEHLSCEVHDVETHVRIGWFRSVANINNAFALGCFVDELAAKAGISTHKMWLNLLGKDRIVDPAKEGFDEWDNYGQKTQLHALDTRRMKAILNRVVQESGADKKVKKNEGWGISYAHSFNSYVAAATKVRVDGDKLTVLEMHTAIDCGIAVTPDRIVSQMEGAMIMGLSTALLSEITVNDGVIEQNNFYDYMSTRINQCPPLFVYIAKSQEAPGGVGEPGLPPVIPSIVNAIYHASGRRIRDLPVNKVLTV